jgi:carbonic anhydrase/acetyltransferase-like protein (isoleucine patch superfamily)
MKELEKLIDRITLRVNINLREQEFDVTPYIRKLVPLNQLSRFYAFYGITPNHSLDFQFRHSSLAGSYFLGTCRTTNSILYKSDIRGDELKQRGDLFQCQGYDIPILKNEGFEIEDSFLIKTLVHCFSHDPETPEKFFITDTISTHYANIHGSPINGSFLGPFSTVDLTTTCDCIIGAFSYIQAGEIGHMNIYPGTIWVRSPDCFNFLYRHPTNKLNQYIFFAPGNPPQGIFIDFVEDRKESFERVFSVVKRKPPIPVPKNASLDRFAVIKRETHIEDNVLVAQRSYLQNSWLGKGANAQESCYIINSRLEGYNVTAHGAKIIEADLGKNVFVGFNSFLRGRPEARLCIGQESIIMPHTIIDVRKPLTIPSGHLVWGMITNEKELETNSIALKKVKKIDGAFCQGEMCFEGSGDSFVKAFQDRIHHILETNGAYYDGTNNKGHAQKNQNISFNTIQPYAHGELEGLYPTIIIKP